MHAGTQTNKQTDTLITIHIQCTSQPKTKSSSNPMTINTLQYHGRIQHSQHKTASQARNTSREENVRRLWRTAPCWGRQETRRTEMRRMWWEISHPAPLHPRLNTTTTRQPQQQPQHHIITIQAAQHRQQSSWTAFTDYCPVRFFSATRFLLCCSLFFRAVR